MSSNTLIHHESPSRQDRLIATVLSTPSLVGVLYMALAWIAERSGNREFDDNPVLAVVAIFAFVFVPWATYGLVFWTIASWANHGRVPAWLLYVLGGNVLVFWWFYAITH